MKKLLSLLTLVTLLLVGCSSDPLPGTYLFDSKQVADRHKIMKEYKKWEGTKYRLGGTTTKGVDCSAFVQNIYHNVFNQKLPRTTGQQAKTGESIKRSEMKVGDLVFFKRPAHVGIYIGHGEMIHASTKKGVKITHLNNIYFRRHYTESRRVR